MVSRGYGDYGGLGLHHVQVKIALQSYQCLAQLGIGNDRIKEVDNGRIRSMLH